MTQSLSAAIHRLVDEHAEEIDQLDFARVLFLVARGRVTLEVQRSYPPVRLAEEEAV